MSVLRGIHSLTWKDEGGCKGNTNIFFEGDVAGPSDAKIEAKAICAKCPVKDICLAVALRNREQSGIWGGKTTFERRRVSRIVHKKATIEMAYSGK